MINTKETKIERIIEEARDGDLVELMLKENNVPKEKERFVRGNYMTIVIGLKKLSARPRYGRGESNLIKSVVGYYGQWFGEEGNVKSQNVIIYPMCQEVLAMNSSPPMRIEVPLTEIESYKIIQKGERPVTSPRGFP